MIQALFKFVRSRRAVRLARPRHLLAFEWLETRLTLTTLPSGFTESVFARPLVSPTAMTFAPDGRLFVAQQGGALRVIQRNGTLLTTPFVQLTVDPNGERGLLGVAFDPAF